MQHAGHKVTFEGTEYDCIPTSMRDTDMRNRDQSFRTAYRTSIAVINSDVTIATDDEVTYKGTMRRVLEHSDSGDGLQRVLHLGERYG